MKKLEFFAAFWPRNGDDESWDSPEDTMEAASSSEVPWWRAAQMSRQPLRAWRHQLRFVAAAQAAVDAPDVEALRWLPDPPPPAAQRLGEWLMNSVGYLFLFIEG